MIDTNSAALADQQHRDIGLSSSLPTTPDGEVGASCPRPVARGGLRSAHANNSPALLEPSLLSPFPLPAPAPPDIPSPLVEAHPDFTSAFAGTLVPASNVSLPTPLIARTSHNLRLPSFDLLGIAAPHPDRTPLHTSCSFSLGAGPLSKPEDPLHVLSPRIRQLDRVDHLPSTSPRPAKADIGRIVPVVTPPTEPGAFNWGSFVNVKTTALGSPPSSDPGLSPDITTVTSAPSLPSAPIVVPAVAEVSGVLGMAAWTQSVKAMLSKCSREARRSDVLTPCSYRVNLRVCGLCQNPFSRSAVPIYHRSSLPPDYRCHT